MNDPHVIALNYRIDHSDAIDYGAAKPIERDEPGFRLTVEDDKVRFELKQHYATEDHAREALSDYIRLWEFDTTLRFSNPDAFRLEFEKAEIIDRNPTIGAVRLSAKFEIQAIGSSRVTLGVPQVPFAAIKHRAQSRR